MGVKLRKMIFKHDRQDNESGHWILISFSISFSISGV